VPLAIRFPDADAAAVPINSPIANPDALTRSNRPHSTDHMMRVEHRAQEHVKLGPHTRSRLSAATPVDMGDTGWKPAALHAGRCIVEFYENSGTRLWSDEVP